MLSAQNLDALDEAGLRFIVGSRMAKAPEGLASHFRWHGDYVEDGQVVDTVITRRGRVDPERVNRLAEPVWDPQDPSHERHWRTMWQFRRKPAVRDRHTLNLQRNRAMNIIEGEKAAKTARFVKTKGSRRTFDEASYQRAVSLSGWKGYVSNIPKSIMTAEEVTSSYHELWHVEQSFRMSKTDLRARPIFHHTRDAIEAHLTIVFAALAISRYLHSTTEITAKKLVQMLQPLQRQTITPGGHQHIVEDKTPPKTAKILNTLNHKKGH